MKRLDRLRKNMAVAFEYQKNYSWFYKNIPAQIKKIETDIAEQEELEQRLDAIELRLNVPRNPHSPSNQHS